MPSKMGNTNQEVFVHYKVTYTTKKPVPISQIIDSLRAYEKLLLRTPPIIQAVYKEIEIVDVDVFVSAIESGSLIEDFVIRYVFRGQENYDNAAQVIGSIVDDNSALQILVALGMGAFIGYGIQLARSKDVPSVSIEAHNNTIINIGGEIGLTAENLNIILKGVTDKKTLAREAVAVVRPAKEDNHAAILVEGLSDISITPDTIADVPSEYEPPKPGEIEKSYANRGIQIYASDRDKQSTGWAGIVPGIVDNRVKFDLWDEVVPSQLHGRTRVNADITVTYALKPNKAEYVATKVEVRRVHIPGKN